MDAVYARRQATAAEVRAAIAGAPSYSAVRAMLRILEEKGHLAHTLTGREFVYRPTRPRQRVGQRAMRRVVQTFFGGSLGDALAAHLADPDSKLDDDELKRLNDLIRKTREKGKRS
jgi:predicted transcriptional regulator